MGRLLFDLARAISRIVLRLRARSTVSRLRSEGSVDSRCLASALRETLTNHLTPEERQWVARIESQRKRLHASSAEIAIQDYGAGAPDLDLTDGAMSQGRQVTATVGEICRNASKPYFWSLLLFKLVRAFRPAVCVELGTSLGISAAYQAAALMLNQRGRLVTLEGAEPLVTRAQMLLHELGLENARVVLGRFQDTLDQILDDLKSIEYAFIDGHHDEKATLTYFEKIWPFLSRKAVLVFDDISWSSGMQRAWRAILTDRRVNMAVDLRTMGICIVDKGSESKRGLRIPLV